MKSCSFGSMEKRDLQHGVRICGRSWVWAELKVEPEATRDVSSPDGRFEVLWLVEKTSSCWS